MKKYQDFQNDEVKAKFNTYPEVIKQKLLFLRHLIFEVAASINKVGKIQEMLKWGEPSYITSETNSGSTIRVDWKQSIPHQYALYFNCKTTLISSFRAIYGNILQYEGNRSIIFSTDDQIPTNELKACIAMALTYHLRKKATKITKLDRGNGFASCHTPTQSLGFAEGRICNRK